MNRRGFRDTGVIYPHWDNQLSKAVPLGNLAMSICSGFCGSAAVLWTLDKCRLSEEAAMARDDERQFVWFTGPGQRIDYGGGMKALKVNYF